MATTDQNAQPQQKTSSQSVSPASAAQTAASQQQSGPVAPGPDMYDPRLLVDIIKSGQPDIGGNQVLPRDRKVANIHKTSR